MQEGATYCNTVSDWFSWRVKWVYTQHRESLSSSQLRCFPFPPRKSTGHFRILVSHSYRKKKRKEKKKTSRVQCLYYQSVNHLVWGTENFNCDLAIIWSAAINVINIFLYNTCLNLWIYYRLFIYLFTYLFVYIVLYFVSSSLERILHWF